MRSLLALALWLCLGASPALAGIALITGTGTGGAQSNLGFNAGTSIGMATTSSIPAGSLVVAIMQNASSGGTSTGFSCSDTHSNSYVAPQSVTAVSAAATQILYSYTTTLINSGDTITCTQASGPSGILGQLLAFSGTASSPYDAASPAGNDNISTGTNTIGPSGTLACPGGGASCEVLVGATAWFGSGTTAITSSGYTGIAVGAGSNWSNGFKIVSATTAQSFATTNTTSTNNAGQLIAFEAATGGGGSSYGGGTTVGVGH